MRAVDSDVVEQQTRAVLGVSRAVTAAGAVRCVSVAAVAIVTVIETVAAAAAVVPAVAWIILSEGLQQ